MAIEQLAVTISRKPRLLQAKEDFCYCWGQKCLAFIIVHIEKLRGTFHIAQHDCYNVPESPIFHAQ
eukprot:3467939-Amphidinium_carterae.1